MSKHQECPFCDSSEEKNSERIQENWNDISEIICGYFSNFTNDHFKDLCDSCFDYISEFCKCRKLWINNEHKIHAKRQMGQFKGLRDIVNLKKNSSVVCRLCFKESRFEDVIFVYLEHKKYQPGYIQNIMFLHANDIDFKLTENPVICQECLDAVQTFDALYQMCVENQTSKVEPVLYVKNSNECQNPQENVKVHIQLKRSKDNNTLVMQPVTEDESAVSSLIRSRETPGSNIILNGWTTKKVLDLVNNPKQSEEKIKSQDILVISDEEGAAYSEMSVGSNEQTNSLTCAENFEFNINPSEVEKTESDPLTKSTKTMAEEDFEQPTSKSVVIEIDDSDEEENMDFPKILSVTSLNESVERQFQSGLGILEEGEMLTGMETKGVLFSHNETPSELNSLTQDNSSTDSDCYEIISDNFSSNSSNSFQHEVQSKHLLEDDLSDFLQFNKTGTSSLKRSNDLLEIDGSLKGVSQPPSGSTNTIFHQKDSQTYSSVFEQFVLVEKVPSSPDSESENPKEFKRKNYPSTKKKSYLTTLENCVGSRIYRCNVCLHFMNEEAQAIIHQCRNLRGKKSRVCTVPKCTFYTFNDYLFAQHKQAHTLLSTEEMKRYCCGLCNHHSYHKECMEKHLASHKKVIAKGSITKCKFCFFESINPDILAHHMTVRHSYKKSKFTEKHFS